LAHKEAQYSKVTYSRQSRYWLIWLAHKEAQYSKVTYSRQSRW